MADQPQFGAA